MHQYIFGGREKCIQVELYMEVGSIIKPMMGTNNTLPPQINHGGPYWVHCYLTSPTMTESAYPTIHIAEVVRKKAKP